MSMRSKYLTAAFLAVACWAVPVPASAMTVQEYQYTNLTDDQQNEFVTNTVEQFIDRVKLKNPQLADQIQHFFEDAVPGTKGSLGMIDFSARLLKVLDDAKTGNADLNKKTIEGLIAETIQVDLINAQAQKANPPAPSGPSVTNKTSK